MCVRPAPATVTSDRLDSASCTNYPLMVRYDRPVRHHDSIHVIDDPPCAWKAHRGGLVSPMRTILVLLVIHIYTVNVLWSGGLYTFQSLSRA